MSSTEVGCATKSVVTSLHQKDDGMEVNRTVDFITNSAESSTVVLIEALLIEIWSAVGTLGLLLVQVTVARAVMSSSGLAQ